MRTIRSNRSDEQRDIDTRYVSSYFCGYDYLIGKPVLFPVHHCAVLCDGIMGPFQPKLATSGTLGSTEVLPILTHM